MNDTMQLSQPREIVCIVCPNGCRIRCEAIDGEISCTGQKCKRGVEYVKAELIRPMRTLTTSVKTVFSDSPVVSVRTCGEIEKAKIRDVTDSLADVSIQKRLRMGDTVVSNICGTGVNVICTSNRLVANDSSQDSKGAN
jgi:CxxC motif-containing protein